MGRVEGQCRKEEGEESRMSLRVWPEQLEEESHQLTEIGRNAEACRFVGKIRSSFLVWDTE